MVRYNPETGERHEWVKPNQLLPVTTATTYSGYIGRRTDQDKYYYHGDLRDMRFYEHGLSAEQVEALSPGENDQEGGTSPNSSEEETPAPDCRPLAAQRSAWSPTNPKPAHLLF